tara:strand:- start:1867 stop:2346 length:480 start_codon:yes stop_codon:yes gene_type:complete
MNKFIIIFVVSFLCADINLYWDLGVGITNFSVKNSQDNLITLSTFNRIEGLKKYYNQDFEGAIYHFSQLDDTQKVHVLYEYVDSYHATNSPHRALALLHTISVAPLTENLLYLESEVLSSIGNYEDALFVLEQLKTQFPNSEYNKIVQFEIEKINLLAK